MSKIRVLPDALANKIAAGEVVERPASVVKELLENSLDAGARKINIEVEAGGKRLIRIVDDGEGMTRDDAIVAFERHATSKLRTAEDLETITTLGFRGEALPSIAAVSKLFLRTKTEKDVEGTEVEFQGSKLVAVRDIAYPGGTEIEVRDLFYNVPARRKFLKSDATESFHITNLVQHYALANSDKAFLLLNNGRDSLRVTAVGSLKERAYQILGSTLLNKLLEVNREQGGLQITGFVSNPQEQRSSRDMQYLFVNRRFVRDLLIGRSLAEAYRSMMPSGTYPAAVLFIEVPPDEVDVNVHPAKTEVRFLHESAIFAFVRDAVAESLKATQPITRLPGTYADLKNADERIRTDAPRWQPPAANWQQRTLSSGASGSAPNSAPVQDNAAGSDFHAPASTPLTRVTSTPLPPSLSASDVTGVREQDMVAEATARIDEMDAARGEGKPELDSDGRAGAAEITGQPGVMTQGSDAQAEIDSESLPPTYDVALPAAQPANQAVHDAVAVSEMGHGIKPLGQIRDSYIVATDDEGLLLFDQHVVHERILFEKIRDGKLSQVAAVQPLLIPETLDLSPAEAEAFKVVQEELEHMGIETMQFSGRTIAIKTAPAGLASKDVVALVQQLLTAVERERRSFTIETIRDEIAASMACKAAIKINMPLTQEKMEYLIGELMKTQNPMTCPHGRPIIMRFGLRDIERGFKRPV